MCMIQLARPVRNWAARLAGRFLIHPWVLVMTGPAKSSGPMSNDSQVRLPPRSLCRLFACMGAVSRVGVLGPAGEHVPVPAGQWV